MEKSEFLDEKEVLQEFIHWMGRELSAYLLPSLHSLQYSDTI